MNQELRKFRILFLLILFFALFGLARNSFAYIIPAGRAITWQGNVGTTNPVPATGRTEINCVTNYSVPTDGTTDARAAIQACLDRISSGQTAYLPAGTYKISVSDISVGLHIGSGKVLKGAGMGVTIISGMASFFGGGLIQVSTDGPPPLGRTDNQFDYSTAVNITGGAIKGGTTFTSTTAPWSAGDLLVVDQIDDPTADPPVNGTDCDGNSNGAAFRGSNRYAGGQICKVSNVSGPVSGSYTTTCELPFARTLNSAKAPQAINYVYTTSNAGVESLTIDKAQGTTYANGMLAFIETDNCWAYNVELKNLGTDIEYTFLYAAYRTTLHGMYTNESTHQGPGGGYGLGVMAYSTSNLIENSIFSAPILFDQGYGNVMAYNYFVNLARGNGPTLQNYGIWFHAGLSQDNLVEGNYVSGNGLVATDWYHGANSFTTIFRNYAMADSTATGNRNTIAGWTAQRYNNIIGNYLTFDGGTPSYVSTNPWDVNEIIGVDYALSPSSYPPNGCPPLTSGVSDGTNNSTMLRHANWDLANGRQTWCDDAVNTGCFGGSNDHTLPSSLYLGTTKPSWFGSLTWPPVDPSVPSVADIPAKVAYDNRNVNGIPQWPSGSGGDTTPPAAPTGIRIQ